jgi:uncharacterized membrane protein HdeD (DUF308 family)
MKKWIASILLAILGILEITVGVLNRKTPILIVFVMGILFLAAGVESLVDVAKKKSHDGGR